MVDGTGGYTTGTGGYTTIAIIVSTQVQTSCVWDRGWVGKDLGDIQSLSGHSLDPSLTIIIFIYHFPLKVILFHFLCFNWLNVIVFIKIEGVICGILGWLNIKDVGIRLIFTEHLRCSHNFEQAVAVLCWSLFSHYYHILWVEEIDIHIATSTFLLMWKFGS